jgi:hypothetical protein
MYLILKGLMASSDKGKQKRGIQKMKDDPTMLLKTKESKNDILDDPTMFSKIKELIF